MDDPQSFQLSNLKVKPLLELPTEDENRHTGHHSSPPPFGRVLQVNLMNDFKLLS